MKPLEIFQCGDQQILEEVIIEVQKVREHKKLSKRFIPQYVAILNSFIKSADNTLKFMPVKETDAFAIGIVKGRAQNGFLL